MTEATFKRRGFTARLIGNIRRRDDDNWHEIYRGMERPVADVLGIWLIRFAAAFLFGAGVAFVADLPLQPLAWGLVLLLLVGIAVTFAKGGRLMSVAFFSFSVVAGAYVIDEAKADAAMAPRPDYMRYDALVLSQPVSKGKTLRFDALVVRVRDCDVRPFLVKMSVAGGGQNVSSGDGLDCISVFEKPRPSSGNFDYSRYLATQGFRATTFVYANDMKRTEISGADIPYYYKLRLSMLKLRRKILSAYRSNGMQGDNLAVIQALTLGDKSALSSDVRMLYSVAGASHVLALSGMHLSVIFALLMLPLARIRLTSWRMLLTALVLTFVWLYVVLVGMPLSAVRSAVMLSVLSLASVANRSRVTWASLSLAAIFVVVVSPMSILDVGFQMSFIAVASILLFMPVVSGVLFGARIWQRRGWRLVSGISSVSIAAQIGVSPLTAYYFGRFSCYFLLANFIAVPLAAFLLYGGVAMLLLQAFPVLQRLAAFALDSALALLNDSLEVIASLPMSSIEGIRMSGGDVLLSYVVIVSVYCTLLRWMRYRRLILAAC